MGCLPCEKEVIDGGMGVEAARFYREVSTGVPSHVAATNFYIRVQENIFSPLAKRLLGSDDDGKSQYKLTDDQHDRVMAQVDEQCYNADKLIAWALNETPQGETLTWTKLLLKWVKNDQKFYTGLLVELGLKTFSEAERAALKGK